MPLIEDTVRIFFSSLKGGKLLFPLSQEKLSARKFRAESFRAAGGLLKPDRTAFTFPIS